VTARPKKKQTATNSQLPLQQTGYGLLLGRFAATAVVCALLSAAAGAAHAQAPGSAAWRGAPAVPVNVSVTPPPAAAGFYSVPGWYCLMFSSGVSCENVTRGWEAALSPGGRVSVCTAGTASCHTGANTGQGIPTIKVGQQVTVQPFRCSYAANGLTCAVIGTGAGFLLTTSGATKVGGSPTSAAQPFTSCRTFEFAYHLQAHGVSCATARTVPPLTSRMIGQPQILLHKGSRLEILAKLPGGWSCKVLSYPGPGPDDRSAIDDCRLGAAKEVRWTDSPRVLPRSL